MEMRRVNSSHVWQIGYDPDTRTMAVRYIPSVKHPAGRLVEYLDVDPQTWTRINSAPSVGSALHSFVKGVFEFRDG